MTAAPRNDTSPSTAGDVAAALARRLGSPVRSGIPAALLGLTAGALAWPGVPAAAWITVLAALVLLIIYAWGISRTWPVRMASNAVADWTNAMDTLVFLGVLFGNRAIRHVLVEAFGVPVPAAVGIVGLAATAIAWWRFRRPGSDMAPPPLPLPAGFPAGSTAPADRILAVLHVAGATPGRRIVFADCLPDLASLDDADAASTLASLREDGAVRVRRNDAALTERQRRRETVQLTEPEAAAEGAGTAAS
ncbi:hypothetical protein ACFWGD_12680 [Corynebacterium sp. NPDC060344]|uniref:hypothetical protein n=1 Tax=Corynebacterium sp. NPDC060344 TaxID=3347101 RepID=UPI00365B60CB